MPNLAAINDRHTVTVGEAALAYLTGTFLPGRSPTFGLVGPISMQPPRRWYLYSGVVYVQTAAEVFRNGQFFVCGAPIPNDTGAMRLCEGIQTGVDFVRFNYPQGQPVEYGVRWRTYGGLTAGDLIIFRCIYSEGARV